MGKEQTEAFRNFVKDKKFQVSDAICLLDDCADKLEVLEDYFLFRDTKESSFEFDDRMANGMGRALCDVKDDLRLISAEMMIDVHKSVAAFKKRRAEGKKKGAQVV